MNAKSATAALEENIDLTPPNKSAKNASAVNENKRPLISPQSLIQGATASPSNKNIPTENIVYNAISAVERMI